MMLISLMVEPLVKSKQSKKVGKNLPWEEFHIGAGFTNLQRTALKELLRNNLRCISVSSTRIRCTSLAQHTIDTR